MNDTDQTESWVQPCTLHNNNKSICKAQNLVPRDYSKRAHTHTHTHRGTRTHKHSDYTKLNIKSLKRAANRFEMDEDGSTEQKT